MLLYLYLSYTYIYSIMQAYNAPEKANILG